MLLRTEDQTHVLRNSPQQRKPHPPDPIGPWPVIMSPLGEVCWQIPLENCPMPRVQMVLCLHRFDPQSLKGFWKGQLYTF